MARDVYRIRKLRSQECPICGRIFSTNKPAETCSNACRQAYYRARKAMKDAWKASQLGLPVDV